MIYLDRETKIPLYEQIYQSIKSDILSGRLAGGARLPATRRLAIDLVVGRNTVENAYQQLLVEGYVSSRVGSGYIVNTLSLPPSAKAAEHQRAKAEEPTDPVGVRYDFAISRLDESAFPITDIKRYVNEALRSMNEGPVFIYPPRQGDKKLREALAKHLYASRGIQTSADNILVTCGHQYSLDVICTLLGEKRIRVAMEDPGYPGAHTPFELRGVKLLPVSVERDGINMEAVRGSGANLLYLTPSHQYPTGAVLSIQKRLEAVDWAARTGSYIIENDYDSELRYNTRPIPSLFAMDQSERVIYIGTLSRPLSLELGFGYLVLPTALVEAYKNQYSLHYNSVPPLIQQALALYIESGDCARHVDRFRVSCRKKHDKLVSEMVRVFGKRVQVSAYGAGQHLFLTVPGDRDADTLAALAERKGVRVYPIHSCWLNKAQETTNQLLMGYGGITSAEIPQALARLNEAWFESADCVAGERQNA